MKCDELGAFPVAYSEYLRGERSYADLRALGACPPTHGTFVSQVPERPWLRWPPEPPCLPALRASAPPALRREVRPARMRASRRAAILIAAAVAVGALDVAVIHAEVRAIVNHAHATGAP